MGHFQVQLQLCPAEGVVHPKPFKYAELGKTYGASDKETHQEESILL